MMADSRGDKKTQAEIPELLAATRPTSSLERWVGPAVVFALAVVVYIPSLSNTFVSWDDDHYIYNNRQLVHPDGLNDIWTNTKESLFTDYELKDSTHQYYPLLFTTFWAQHQLYHSRNDKLLFTLPPEVEKDLSVFAQPVFALSEAIRHEFTSRAHELPKGCRVQTVEPGRRWLLVSGPNPSESSGLYLIRWEEGRLSAHRGSGDDEELLFELPSARVADLDSRKLTKRSVTESVRQAFAEHDIELIRRSYVYTVEPDRQWVIGAVPPGIPSQLYDLKQGYGVRLEDSKLNVYSGTPAIFEYENEAWGIHAVNTVLHAIASVVMLLLLRRLGVNGWVAWVVAAIFAVHPMNVASVAWATERKNILALLFYMFAMMCYLRHRRRGGWIAYLGTFVFFQGALFSKTVALTFPFVLFLTDMLIDQRWRLRRILLRGIPLLLVVLAAFGPTLLMGETPDKGWRWAHTIGVLIPLALVGVGAVFTDRQLQRRLSARTLLDFAPTAAMFVVALGVTLLLGERWNAEAIVLRFAPLWMTVAVIFLIDRVSGGRLDAQSVVRIAPLVVMMVLSADTTMHMEDRNRMVPLVGGQRPFVAAAAAWYYVVKLLVPIWQLPITALWNPHPLEPDRWNPGANPAWWLPVIGVAAVAVVLFRYRKKVPPHLTWGLGFYLVTQLPMLGFKNINIFQFSFVHEHYIYNGGMGVLLMFALLLDMGRKRFADHRRATRLTTVVVCVGLGAYGAKTAIYSKVWKSAETFWNTTLAENPGCWAGWFNMANQYRRDAAVAEYEGDKAKAKELSDSAIHYYEQSINYKENLSQAYRLVLKLLLEDGRYDDVEQYCSKAESNGRPFLAHYFRAQVLAKKKQWAEAAELFTNAANSPAQRDERVESLIEGGKCWRLAGKPEQAIRLFNACLRFKPRGNYTIYINRGLCYEDLNQFAEAEEDVVNAIEFYANDSQAQRVLQRIRQKRGGR